MSSCFFSATRAAQTEEDSVLVFSERKLPYNTITTNTSNTYFQTIFLRGFNAEGTEYVIANTVDPDEPFNITGNTRTSIPMAVSLCSAGQPPPTTYSKLVYDPSIVALFAGADDTLSSPDSPGPNSKNRLNPAAYAVPIGAAAVLIGVAAVIMFVPSLRHKVLAHQNPLASLDRENVSSRDAPVKPVQPEFARSTTTQASVDTETEPPAKEDSRSKSHNSWARATLPVES